MIKIVIYDSLYGNTEKIAKAIADIIGGEAVRVQDFKQALLENAALLVVGCPIHAWRPSEATRDFLESLPRDGLNGIKIAAFDTRVKGFFSGSASDKIDKKLVSLGGRSVTAPNKFIVKGKEGPLAEGELEKARIWARDILEKANA